MSENVSEARASTSKRLRAAALFAVCLIVLTALLELGLAATPSF